MVEFSGWCGSATTAIPGINTLYTRLQTPIILMYEPQPFLPICILKYWLSNPKGHFFHESVVFVAFWVLLLLQLFSLFKAAMILPVKQWNPALPKSLSAIKVLLPENVFAMIWYFSGEEGVWSMNVNDFFACNFVHFWGNIFMKIPKTCK